MDSLGHAIYIHASIWGNLLSLSTDISDRNNTMYYFPFFLSKSSISFNTPTLPCLPNVPRITPNNFASFAFSISSLLMICIFSVSYTSDVISFLYGLYWKNFKCGFLIIVLSIWNLPSLMNTTDYIPYSSGIYGDVHPRTSPPDLGLVYGIDILVNPFYFSSMVFAI